MEDDEQKFINPDDLVTVTKTNHVVEIQHMEHMNTQPNVQKIDKDRYVNLQTGEIKEFEHTDNRKDGYNSLRKTFKKLRYLINNNFTGANNELHVTLTYKENVTDTNRLYTDLNRFMMRIKRKYGHVDYLNVIEPQARGAWHAHLLLRLNDYKNAYIPNNQLANMWGQGFVTIKSLKNVDNIGAYLSAYLADVELEGQDAVTLQTLSEENREIVSKDVEGEQKKFVKGGRLHMYPPGMNIYRKSKGVVFPERERMKMGKAKKEVGAATPTYEKSYIVDNGEFSNTVTFKQYNLKR